MAILFLTVLIWKSPDDHKEIARMEGATGVFYVLQFSIALMKLSGGCFSFQQIYARRVSEGGGEV